MTTFIILGGFDLSVPDTPLPYSLIRTYISLEFGGRTGNIIFEYASLLGIGKRNNLTPIIPSSLSLCEVFQIKTLRTSNVDALLGNYNRHEEFGRRASAYDPRTERLEFKNTKLAGYFQSWRYFKMAETEIREQLTFKPVIKQKAETFLQEHLTPTSRGSSVVRVGIHVRRADHLDPYFQNYGYTTPDAAYFIKAMLYFRDKFDSVQFVVCSDDIGWCRENIIGDDVVYSRTNSAMVDLAILSLCDHTIMSVGSFGWWGAWLTNGTTIYYNKWPKEFSLLEYNVDKKDYFPPEWIPMI